MRRSELRWLDVMVSREGRSATLQTLAQEAGMKCLRVYADEKGESHFSEMEIAMSASQLLHSRTIQMSTPEATTSIQFLTVSGVPSTDSDWHPAPARQFVISLDRTFEIETSDGQRRQVLPSSVVFVEDTWGKGHKTRSLDDHAGTLIFVPLAGDVPR
jgi:hypothetical protein